MHEIWPLLPQWSLGVTGVLLSISVIYLLVRAFHEGRSITLWPPKIGPRRRTNGTHLGREKDFRVLRFDSEILGILMGIQGKARGTLVLIESKPGKIIFGRDPGKVDVAITESHLSPTHFAIRISPRPKNDEPLPAYEIQLIPLGAMTPVYVNEISVRDITPLRNRDIIRFGSSVLRLYLCNE